MPPGCAASVGDQGEDQVLGPDVVMAELARVIRGGAQGLRRGAGQAERDLTNRRVGQHAEALLRGLLARAQRRTDFVPARPTCPQACPSYRLRPWLTRH